jgi:hypothetical protein
MEIKITSKLKKLDSELITHLISIPNDNNTIFINKKYKDVFNIIKKNKTIYIDFKNNERVNHIIEGLLYFGNKKILHDVLKKLAKYIKEKYIDRKSIERFFEKVCGDKNFYWNYSCGNPNISETFFEKYIHKKRDNSDNWNYFFSNKNISENIFKKYIKKDELISQYLCMNTSISEEFFETLINEGYKMNWYYLSGNTNISEKFFEKYISIGIEFSWEKLCLNTNLSE